MSGRVAAFLEWVGDVFWLRPTLMAIFGVALATGVRWLDSPGLSILPAWLVFAGDAAGARALLGVVAASAIGVAGTIFSITIAALSLTSGQMGPRLLRNFLRDRGNQVALGLFLMTFCYAIALQRGMGAEGTPPVPHLGLVLAVGLALVCASSLAWVVHHIAGGINVETVIAIVHAELADAAARLTTEQAPVRPLALAMPPMRGTPLRCAAAGYVRALDYGQLADWAQARGVVLSVLARPGDYLHPGQRLAEVNAPDQAPDAAAALHEAMSIGPRPAAAQDLEFAVRQLVEVAVRALSPGINDPFTAMAVLDRLGAVLAGLVGRHLPAPVLWRDDSVVLYRRVSDYPGLCDAMFHMIRQAGAENAAVLIRMAEVLEQVIDMEPDAARREVLLRHGRWVLRAGRARITDAPGRAGLERACASLAAYG
ncbi:DUF2254 domain-containing protein [Roseomonas fluvialis]|uniref:DUF2254 domain-containing protein n=1 Tax=Roseomonas fluvialis TaxID=1750527 RepID=A0ABM7Y6P5_9PROT|nr:DUF2254 domain-containing protein [Roseomonas fluvialis]BDG73620.1 hypothetical protein Rmf_35490 [Roseomonas fluvialis]